MSSPSKRLRKHSQNEFISLMISSKRLPSSSLSYNQITELNLSNLQLIKIDSFPFEYLPNLISLDLSYNQLISINSDWSKYHENFIEKLNISHNKLETLLFLKDFKYLKILNITENLFGNIEKFLSLHLCSTIEHLIDSNYDQIDDNQLKLDQWLQLIETKIDRLWSLSYYDKYKQESINDKNNHIVKKLLDDFHHAMIKIFEKQSNFSQIHLSPLANYLINIKINELCESLPKKNQSKKSLKTHLTTDFNNLMNLKTYFEPIKFLRCHQTSDNDLTTISVRMCAFEPNTSNHILVSCGGQKICFIDCDTCEVTHLYEVPSLRSTTIPIGRKIKDKNDKTNGEYFSCLCWIEIPQENETVKVLAVGATNGHIYLLSHKWKIMFGHIELPGSSINCLTWHATDPSTLVIGSYHSVRYLNIQSYIDRLLSFIRKKTSPTAQFDYVESTMFANKILSTHVYNFDNGDDTILHITDLLFYSLSKTNIPLLVGTSSGLFVIQEQKPMRLTFPKSMCTVGEYIESIRLIDNQTHLIAINILGFDQICCFDLEQSLPNQQLNIILTLPNPYRQIPTKMALCLTNNENNHTSTTISFECIIGSDHGSFFYHQIQMNSINKKVKKPTFDNKRYEISWPQIKTSTIPSLLSASLNDNYLCLTTNNNLICIYKRK
ncbi:unnamed protein product [Rotaria sp. Silwood1]|nr:unnamed protein product [Rotaria sp. Silwood1]CAF1195797.1 unnamed protein product [Rotaria sp. Silwood1]CAF3455065.1 unnamed protein product [Rotaria sp. Silwood1]CAF4811007.1 unnamed protein product [Rotaria sp. Silwood1]